MKNDFFIKVPLDYLNLKNQKNKKMENTAKWFKRRGRKKNGWGKVYFCVFWSKWLKLTENKNDKNVSQQNRKIFVPQIYLYKAIQRNAAVEGISSCVLAIASI